MILSLFNEQINGVVAAQANAFSLKDLGDMIKFLDINNDLGLDGIIINEDSMIEDICDNLEMNHYSGVAIFISDYSLKEHDTEKMYSTSEKVQYHCIVSSLLNISSITRSDISNAVNSICVIIQNPS